MPGRRRWRAAHRGEPAVARFEAWCRDSSDVADRDRYLDGNGELERRRLACPPPLGRGSADIVAPARRRAYGSRHRLATQLIPIGWREPGAALAALPRATGEC